MATHSQSAVATMHSESTHRAQMTEQIDRLEAGGMDVSDLRDELAKLRLPDDRMVVEFDHADCIVGAAQLRTMVELFGKSMPDDTKALLSRLANALMTAEVRL